MLKIQILAIGLALSLNSTAQAEVKPTSVEVTLTDSFYKAIPKAADSALTLELPVNVAIGALSVVAALPLFGGAGPLIAAIAAAKMVAIYTPVGFLSVVARETCNEYMNGGKTFIPCYIFGGFLKYGTRSVAMLKPVKEIALDAVRGAFNNGAYAVLDSQLEHSLNSEDNLGSFAVITSIEGADSALQNWFGKLLGQDTSGDSQNMFFALATSLGILGCIKGIQEDNGPSIREYVASALSSKSQQVENGDAKEEL